jgi:sugar transferase (PEP-CTERM/EpsH1 system associated)
VVEIVYLSHCTPDTPDKGEKIRAHHLLKRLVRRFGVHLVCFAKSEEEAQRTREWAKSECASAHVERHRGTAALIVAAARFALGGSLSESYYHSRTMADAAARAARKASAVLVYSAAMARLAPMGRPMVLDLCDVDSEKWMDYGRMRWPGALYRLEARRLRRIEAASVRRAVATAVMTDNEAAVLGSIVPEVTPERIPNGVDFCYWQPDGEEAEELRGCSYVVFVGQMDYYPNVDAALWFAGEPLARLRAAAPETEFVIVGRNPTEEVRRLNGRNGVRVVASPADVRPYLRGARAVVAPIRLARGLQNKVLEALAMGKTVLAPPEVCRTFGGLPPVGVVECSSADAYAQPPPAMDAERIRSELAQRYSWDSAADSMARLLEQAGSEV